MDIKTPNISISIGPSTLMKISTQPHSQKVDPLLCLTSGEVSQEICSFCVLDLLSQINPSSLSTAIPSVSIITQLYLQVTRLDWYASPSSFQQLTTTIIQHLYKILSHPTILHKHSSHHLSNQGGDIASPHTILRRAYETIVLCYLSIVFYSPSFISQFLWVIIPLIQYTEQSCYLEVDAAGANYTQNTPIPLSQVDLETHGTYHFSQQQRLTMPSAAESLVSTAQYPLCTSLLVILNSFPSSVLYADEITQSQLEALQMKDEGHDGIAAHVPLPTLLSIDQVILGIHPDGILTQPDPRQAQYLASVRYLPIDVQRFLLDHCRVMLESRETTLITLGTRTLHALTVAFPHDCLFQWLWDPDVVLDLIANGDCRGSRLEGVSYVTTNVVSDSASHHVFDTTIIPCELHSLPLLVLNYPDLDTVLLRHLVFFGRLLLSSSYNVQSTVASTSNRGQSTARKSTQPTPPPSNRPEALCLQYILSFITAIQNMGTQLGIHYPRWMPLPVTTHDSKQQRRAIDDVVLLPLAPSAPDPLLIAPWESVKSNLSTDITSTLRVSSFQHEKHLISSHPIHSGIPLTARCTVFQSLFNATFSHLDISQELYASCVDLQQRLYSHLGSPTSEPQSESTSGSAMVNADTSPSSSSSQLYQQFMVQFQTIFHTSSGSLRQKQKDVHEDKADATLPPPWMTYTTWMITLLDLEQTQIALHALDAVYHVLIHQPLTSLARLSLHVDVNLYPSLVKSLQVYLTRAEASITDFQRQDEEYRAHKQAPADSTDAGSTRQPPSIAKSVSYTLFQAVFRLVDILLLFASLPSFYVISTNTHLEQYLNLKYLSFTTHQSNQVHSQVDGGTLPASLTAASILHELIQALRKLTLLSRILLRQQNIESRRLRKKRSRSTTGSADGDASLSSQELLVSIFFQQMNTDDNSQGGTTATHLYFPLGSQSHMAATFAQKKLSAPPSSRDPSPHPGALYTTRTRQEYHQESFGSIVASLVANYNALLCRRFTHAIMHCVDVYNIASTSYSTQLAMDDSLSDDVSHNLSLLQLLFVTEDKADALSTIRHDQQKNPSMNSNTCSIDGNKLQGSLFDDIFRIILLQGHALFQHFVQESSPMVTMFRMLFLSKTQFHVRRYFSEIKAQQRSVSTGDRSSQPRVVIDQDELDHRFDMDTARLSYQLLALFHFSRLVHEMQVVTSDFRTVIQSACQHANHHPTLNLHQTLHIQSTQLPHLFQVLFGTEPSTFQTMLSNFFGIQTNQMWMALSLSSFLPRVVVSSLVPSVIPNTDDTLAVPQTESSTHGMLSLYTEDHVYPQILARAIDMVVPTYGMAGVGWTSMIPSKSRGNGMSLESMYHPATVSSDASHTTTTTVHGQIGAPNPNGSHHHHHPTIHVERLVCTTPFIIFVDSSISLMLESSIAFTLDYSNVPSTNDLSHPTSALPPSSSARVIEVIRHPSLLSTLQLCTDVLQLSIFQTDHQQHLTNNYTTSSATHLFPFLQQTCLAFLIWYLDSLLTTVLPQSLSSSSPPLQQHDICLQCKTRSTYNVWDTTVQHRELFHLLTHSFSFYNNRQQMSDYIVPYLPSLRCDCRPQTTITEENQTEQGTSQQSSVDSDNIFFNIVTQTAIMLVFPLIPTLQARLQHLLRHQQYIFTPADVVDPFENISRKHQTNSFFIVQDVISWWKRNSIDASCENNQPQDLSQEDSTADGQLPRATGGQSPTMTQGSTFIAAYLTSGLPLDRISVLGLVKLASQLVSLVHYDSIRLGSQYAFNTQHLSMLRHPADGELSVSREVDNESSVDLTSTDDDHIPVLDSHHLVSEDIYAIFILALLHTTTSNEEDDGEHQSFMNSIQPIQGGMDEKDSSFPSQDQKTPAARISPSLFENMHRLLQFPADVIAEILPPGLSLASFYHILSYLPVVQQLSHVVAYLSTLFSQATHGTQSSSQETKELYQYILESILPPDSPLFTEQRQSLVIQQMSRTAEPTRPAFISLRHARQYPAVMGSLLLNLCLGMTNSAASQVPTDACFLTALTLANSNTASLMKRLLTHLWHNYKTGVVSFANQPNSIIAGIDQKPSRGVRLFASLCGILTRLIRSISITNNIRLHFVDTFYQGLKSSTEAFTRGKPVSSEGDGNPPLQEMAADLSLTDLFHCAVLIPLLSTINGLQIDQVTSDLNSNPFLLQLTSKNELHSINLFTKSSPYSFVWDLSMPIYGITFLPLQKASQHQHQQTNSTALHTAPVITLTPFVNLHVKTLFYMLWYADLLSMVDTWIDPAHSVNKRTQQYHDHKNDTDVHSSLSLSTSVPDTCLPRRHHHHLINFLISNWLHTGAVSLFHLHLTHQQYELEPTSRQILALIQTALKDRTLQGPVPSKPGKKPVMSSSTTSLLISSGNITTNKMSSALASTTSGHQVVQFRGYLLSFSGDITYPLTHQPQSRNNHTNFISERTLPLYRQFTVQKDKSAASIQSKEPNQRSDAFYPSLELITDHIGTGVDQTARQNEPLPELSRVFTTLEHELSTVGLLSALTSLTHRAFITPLIVLRMMYPSHHDMQFHTLTGHSLMSALQQFHVIGSRRNSRNQEATQLESELVYSNGTWLKQQSNHEVGYVDQSVQSQWGSLESNAQFSHPFLKQNYIQCLFRLTTRLSALVGRTMSSSISISPTSRATTQSFELPLRVDVHGEESSLYTMMDSELCQEPQFQYSLLSLHISILLLLHLLRAAMHGGGDGTGSLPQRINEPFHTETASRSSVALYCRHRLHLILLLLHPIMTRTIRMLDEAHLVAGPPSQPAFEDPITSLSPQEQDHSDSISILDMDDQGLASLQSSSKLQDIIFTTYAQLVTQLLAEMIPLPTPSTSTSAPTQMQTQTSTQTSRETTTSIATATGGSTRNASAQQSSASEKNSHEQMTSSYVLALHIPRVNIAILLCDLFSRLHSILSTTMREDFKIRRCIQQLIHGLPTHASSPSVLSHSGRTEGMQPGVTLRTHMSPDGGCLHRGCLKTITEADENVDPNTIAGDDPLNSPGHQPWSMSQFNEKMQMHTPPHDFSPLTPRLTGHPDPFSLTQVLTTASSGVVITPPPPIMEESSSMGSSDMLASYSSEKIDVDDQNDADFLHRQRTLSMFGKCHATIHSLSTAALCSLVQLPHLLSFILAYECGSEINIHHKHGNAHQRAPYVAHALLSIPLRTHTMSRRMPRFQTICLPAIGSVTPSLSNDRPHHNQTFNEEMGDEPAGETQTKQPQSTSSMWPSHPGSEFMGALERVIHLQDFNPSGDSFQPCVGHELSHLQTMFSDVFSAYLPHNGHVPHSGGPNANCSNQHARLALAQDSCKDLPLHYKTVFGTTHTIEQSEIELWSQLFANDLHVLQQQSDSNRASHLDYTPGDKSQEHTSTIYQAKRRREDSDVSSLSQDTPLTPIKETLGTLRTVNAHPPPILASNDSITYHWAPLLVAVCLKLKAWIGYIYQLHDPPLPQHGGASGSSAATGGGLSYPVPFYTLSLSNLLPYLYPPRVTQITLRIDASLWSYLTSVALASIQAYHERFNLIFATNPPIGLGVIFNEPKTLVQMRTAAATNAPAPHTLSVCNPTQHYTSPMVIFGHTCLFYSKSFGCRQCLIEDYAHHTTIDGTNPLHRLSNPSQYVLPHSHLFISSHHLQYLYLSMQRTTSRWLHDPRTALDTLRGWYSLLLCLLLQQHYISYISAQRAVQSRHHLHQQIGQDTLVDIPSPAAAIDGEHQQQPLQFKTSYPIEFTLWFLHQSNGWHSYIIQAILKYPVLVTSAQLEEESAMGSPEHPHITQLPMHTAVQSTWEGFRRQTGASGRHIRDGEDTSWTKHPWATPSIPSMISASRVLPSAVSTQHESQGSGSSQRRSMQAPHHFQYCLVSLLISSSFVASYLYSRSASSEDIRLSGASSSVMLASDDNTTHHLSSSPTTSSPYSSGVSPLSTNERDGDLPVTSPSNHPLASPRLTTIPQSAIQPCLSIDFHLAKPIAWQTHTMTLMLSGICSRMLAPVYCDPTLALVVSPLTAVLLGYDHDHSEDPTQGISPPTEHLTIAQRFLRVIQTRGTPWSVTHVNTMAQKWLRSLPLSGETTDGLQMTNPHSSNALQSATTTTATAATIGAGVRNTTDPLYIGHLHCYSLYAHIVFHIQSQVAAIVRLQQQIFCNQLQDAAVRGRIPPPVLVTTESIPGFAYEVYADRYAVLVSCDEDTLHRLTTPLNSGGDPYDLNHQYTVKSSVPLSQRFTVKSISTGSGAAPRDSNSHPFSTTTTTTTSSTTASTSSNIDSSDNMGDIDPNHATQFAFSQIATSFIHGFYWQSLLTKLGLITTVRDEATHPRDRSTSTNTLTAAEKRIGEVLSSSYTSFTTPGSARISTIIPLEAQAYPPYVAYALQRREDLYLRMVLLSQLEISSHRVTHQLSVPHSVTQSSEEDSQARQDYQETLQMQMHQQMPVRNEETPHNRGDSGTPTPESMILQETLRRIAELEFIQYYMPILSTEQHQNTSSAAGRSSTGRSRRGRGRGKRRTLSARNPKKQARHNESMPLLYRSIKSAQRPTSSSLHHTRHQHQATVNHHPTPQCPTPPLLSEEQFYSLTNLLGLLEVIDFNIRPQHQTTSLSSSSSESPAQPQRQSRALALTPCDPLVCMCRLAPPFPPPVTSLAIDRDDQVPQGTAGGDIPLRKQDTPTSATNMNVAIAPPTSSNLLSPAQDLFHRLSRMSNCIPSLSGGDSLAVYAIYLQIHLLRTAIIKLLGIDDEITVVLDEAVDNDASMAESDSDNTGGNNDDGTDPGTDTDAETDAGPDPSHDGKGTNIHNPSSA